MDAASSQLDSLREATPSTPPTFSGQASGPVPPYAPMGAPMGGASMGGAPMGGAPMGGAPMGGAPMGGGPMGGGPVAPPQVPRREPWNTNAWAPPSPSGPPAPAAVPLPSPEVKPAPGWGWRAFVAFVAGGLLTGGGFAAAQLTLSDSTSASPVITASTPAPSPTAIPTPPVTADPTLEPAAFAAQVLGPSVVQIETNFGSGSGVIYSDNLIMTNNHVIDGARQITVILADGRHLPAELVGGDPNFDIAVVRVADGQGLVPATLAVGEQVQVGQIAIAIGSPFKLQQTVTEGIVSALNRPVPSGRIYTAMIQTDAPINPGNSGGALADRQGRVIGINTAIQTDGLSSTNAGIGFAVPIDQAISVADRLVAGEPIESGLLGVEGRGAEDGSAGVRVTAVTPGSAAEAAGIQTGDLIISMDGAPVIALAELAGLVAAREPGEVVELELIRNGQPIQVTATLGAR